MFTYYKLQRLERNRNGFGINNRDDTQHIEYINNNPINYYYYTAVILYIGDVRVSLYYINKCMSNITSSIVKPLDLSFRVLNS